MNPKLPPLIYETGDPKLINTRAIRPVVGSAQGLLRDFLFAFIDGRGCCVTQAEFDPVRKEMNRLLKEIKDPRKFAVDCFFGHETDRATRIFQLCQGLNPDGKIGPSTWPLLFSFEPCRVIGPVISPGSPQDFCVPLSPAEAVRVRAFFVPLLLNVVANHHDPELNTLFQTYVNTPKVGIRGRLPHRQIFRNQNSPTIGGPNGYIVDPQTVIQRDRVMNRLATSLPAAFRPPFAGGASLSPIERISNVLSAADLTNLPMSFKNPPDKIPGLMAGGFGPDSSDAGDDTRSVDGVFQVEDRGNGTGRIRAVLIFDIEDAVDFCPGAAGSSLAQFLTIPISRLEATPDVPVYDTPFSVFYRLPDAFRDF